MLESNNVTTFPKHLYNSLYIFLYRMQTYYYKNGFTNLILYIAYPSKNHITLYSRPYIIR
ncbi:hypothetical protein CLOAM1553 [Candidatus Cloacimonas acidaminovorans str. Evry]|jgi:hypothetical protein|uniref:Uncharacterized protein n=1 Tax=Cloacimonas acidaminovorans (strain Evry) TaxID=459349 RepID=B0VFV8_CLOAI|nr:hypothetical protein CLOAM1553 [Candidatus Cloacimonas acidaminovorans str. Evry]